MSHTATFTWGAGPQSVHVAGGFNNWSDTATPLNKLPDGSFKAEVPLPYGEKQAFKYVVDGEWKIREDEAKEWDAAGNMNNVYTAPHAPDHTSAAAASTTTSVPPSTAADTPSPVTSTQPSTLVAASAPGAASGAPPVLGAPTTETAGVTPAVGSTDASPTTIEKTAATANVGEAPTSNEKGVAEQAAEYGAGAVAALGAIVGGAAIAVEKATGIHLPGAAEPTDAPTDTTSPAGTKPSSAAIADLEEKTKELKLDQQAAVPLPNGSAPKTMTAPSSTANAPEPLDAIEKKGNDLPAQDETSKNHASVPAPVITAISAPDPAKDRTADSTALRDTAGTKPIDSSPAVDAVAAKKEAESAPAGTGSIPATSGLASSTPATKTAGSGTTPHPAAAGTTTTPSAAKTTDINPAAVTPAPIAKDPATPAKSTPVAAATPAKSTTSTSTSGTPAKTGTTSSSNGKVEKRKSSFFKKIKNAFSSPKDK